MRERQTNNGSTHAPLAAIKELSVAYWQQGIWRTVIKDLNLDVHRGDTLGLVGESGCGKSTTANALLGYRPNGARYLKGEVWFEHKDLLSASRGDLRRLRGADISLVPQNPTTTLSPGMRVGRQIVETLLVHRYCSSAQEARKRTYKLFSDVFLPDPEKTFNKYPHQLSGGQQQRVVLAMALACDPKLIVLDEPTTGLDVTTQSQILDLLLDLRERYGMTMLYVTHNLGVVAQICTRIGVMYAGRLVEVAPRHTIFKQPKHPYTQGLIASVPRISTPSREQTLLLHGLLHHDELPPGCPFAPRCDFATERCFEERQILTQIGSDHHIACWRWGEIPVYGERIAQSSTVIAQVEDVVQQSEEKVLTVEGMEAGYARKHPIPLLSRDLPPVVEHLTFNIHPGETFALVGESGSGKTTVARALAGLLPHVDGNIEFIGQHDLEKRTNQRPRDLLRAIQLIFQNPDASLNPRQRVSQILGRPLQMFFDMHGKQLEARIEKLLKDVRLEADYAHRFPDELSGGERQRIAIARALAADPQLLLCDEVLSALDVSVQANVLKLLVDLQQERSLSYLFISHDLAVVRSLAHRVGVLYWGTLVEEGDVEEVFSPPYHPYTYLLLRAVPEADPEQEMPPARKDIGLVTNLPKTACRFASRCPWSVEGRCENHKPPWRQVSPSHHLRCFWTPEQLYRLAEEHRDLPLKTDN